MELRPQSFAVLGRSKPQDADLPRITVNSFANAGRKIEMRTWKASLTSRAPGMTPDHIEEARQFCFREKFVGVGWGIVDAPVAFDTPAAYQAAAAPLFDETSRAWRTAHNQLLAAEINDLVWSQSIQSGFWIGRISGEWRYRTEAPFCTHDLFQVRTCEWVRAGTLDAVPTTVRNCFIGNQRAFNQIHNGGALTTFLSARSYLLNGGTNLAEPIAPADAIPETIARALRIVAHDDLEDLVGMYLQHQLGWHIIPSSCKKSTANTEFVLRSGNGETAYVQVKSGNHTIQQLGTFPNDLRQFFVFQANGIFDPNVVYPAQRNRLTVISLDELAGWIQRNLHFLPRSTRILIDLVLGG